MAPTIWTALLSAAAVSAQSVLTLSGTATSGGSAIGDLPTGSVSYLSLSTTITLSSGVPSTTLLSGSNSAAASSTGSSNGTATSSTSTSASVTYLGGGTSTTGNGTASSTSSAARPTNTQPCNGYPEFCNRQYSNITNVAAHNYPFIKPGNTGSNQELSVTDQLNDGIRMRELILCDPLLDLQPHLTNNSASTNALREQHPLVLPYLLRSLKCRHNRIFLPDYCHMARRPPLRSPHHAPRQLRSS